LLFSNDLLAAGANVNAMPLGECLDPDVAASYAAHGVDEVTKAAVEAHIDECPSCRELVSLIAKASWSTAQTPTPADGDVWRDVLPRGTRVGPYELRQPLSAGGMGVVYVAHDSRLDRLVALKGVRAGRGDPTALLDEAKLMAQLAHPNVVPVYGLERAHEQDFIAMELIVGQTLRQWLSQKPRPWKAIVDVFLEVGAGLAAAHRLGIVHGDVKPANVLVGDDGRARLSDFGLARFVSNDGRSNVGTPAYFAPEQRTGSAATPLSDQYAFCVTLHEALSGALPGQPAGNGRGVPRGLRRVLDQGLAETANNRWASMEPLLVNLRRARQQDTRRVLVGLSAAAMVGLSAFALGGQRVERRRCEAFAAAFAPVWTPEARTRAQEAFTRTRLSYADDTFRRVDDVASRWQQAFEVERRATCEGTLVAGPAQEQRLACLETTAREARALVTQLLDADPALVTRAVSAVGAITPAQACAATLREPSLAPRSEALDAVRVQLADARAAAFSGKYRLALDLAVKADEAARATGEPHVMASARALLGGHRALVEPNEAAATTLLDAIALAEAAGEERARAFAWVELLALEYTRGRHAQVVQLAPVALAVAARLDDLRLLTDAQLTLGSSLSELGKPQEAIPVLRAVVSRREQAFGAEDRRTAAALSVLANAQAMAGDLAGAAEAHRRALAAARQSYGPSHPETAIIQQNLGDDLLYALEGEGAVRELSASVAVLETAKGASSREAAIGRTDLGFAFLQVGRAEAASQAFDGAVAAFTASAADHPTLALALLGQALVARGRREHVDVSSLERAATLSEGLPPFERGRVLWALGQHTGDAGTVKEAVAALSTVDMPLIAAQRAQAEAWLANGGR
jgi:eukaryotic-like serine/threonine-protein kinase